MTCINNNGMKFIQITESKYLALSDCVKNNPFLIFLIYPNN